MINNNLRINKHWSIDQTNCKENECWILGSILFRSPTHLLRHWRRHCIASSGRIRWMDHLSKKCTVPCAAASLLLLLYRRAPPTNQTQVHLTIEFLLLSCLSVVPLIAIEITHIHTRSLIHSAVLDINILWNNNNYASFSIIICRSMINGRPSVGAERQYLNYFSKLIAVATEDDGRNFVSIVSVSLFVGTRRQPPMWTHSIPVHMWISGLFLSLG